MKEVTHLLALVHEERSAGVGAEDSDVPGLVGRKPDVGAGGRVEARDVGGEVGDEGGERFERRARDGGAQAGVSFWMRGRSVGFLLRMDEQDLSVDVVRGSRLLRSEERESET